MEAEEQTASTIDFKNPLFVSDIPPASGDKNEGEHTIIILPLDPNSSHHNNVTSSPKPESDVKITGNGEFGWHVVAASPCSVTCGEGELVCVCVQNNGLEVVEKIMFIYFKFQF